MRIAPEITAQMPRMTMSAIAIPFQFRGSESTTSSSCDKTTRDTAKRSYNRHGMKQRLRARESKEGMKRQQKEMRKEEHQRKKRNSAQKNAKTTRR
jgi:nucleosome binding factor SPN SPT16 subunit